MNKKRAVILIIIIFALVFGVLMYSYNRLGDNGNGTNNTGGGFKDFFPFGRDRENTDTNTNGGNNNGDGVGVNMPILRKVSAEPVAGFTTYQVGKPGEEKNIFRFILKATGNVFDIPEDDINSTRISNTTVPKIFEAKFLTNDDILIRYLDDDNQTIETYLSKLKKDESGNYTGLDGIYLSKNITEVAVAPSGNFFYLEDLPDSSMGYVYNLKTSKAQKIFHSPLREWTFLFPDDNQIFYFSRASAGVKGYMYALDPKNGNVTKVLSGILGLTVNIGKDFRTLYSEYSNGRTYTSVGNSKTGLFGEFNLTTLPEKCAIDAVIYCASPNYSISGNLPDSWYQGQTFFTDNIWMISSGDDGLKKIANLSDDAGEDIDATNLQLTKDGKYLLFINKRDGALWSLKVKEDVPGGNSNTNSSTTTEETI